MEQGKEIKPFSARRGLAHLYAQLIQYSLTVIKPEESER